MFLSNEYMKMFDTHFTQSKSSIISTFEMNEHKYTFAILTFKILECIGDDMKNLLENHFKNFKHRDI